MYFVGIDISKFVELQNKTPAPPNGAGVSVLKEIVLVSVVNILFGGIVIFQNEQAFKVNHISTFGVG